MQHGMEEQLMFALDLLGTVIFAITGAVSGVKLRLDLLGVVVFGCTVGVGGGILRDLIIGATPVAVLRNETYLITCIATGLVVFAGARYIGNHSRIILVCDAIGLGVFTALGAAKGMQYDLGMIGMTLCGVLSAVGGGILRDVMARRIPAVLTNDFYATASLIGGIVYFFLARNGMNFFYSFLIVSGLVVLLRLLAAGLHLRLPRAARRGRDGESAPAPEERK